MSDVRISKEEVQHVAYLARLLLTDEEAEAMRQDLDAILEHFQKLQELNTDDVPPTSHPLAITNVFRDDVVGQPMSREEILANAPQRDEECFRVPLIMEEE